MRTSWSSRPTIVLSVEWKEARCKPSTQSQFHPPSSIWCRTNHGSRSAMSRPSQDPFASVLALMQGSTSPPQKGRPSYSRLLFASSRSAVARPCSRAYGSTPHSRSVRSDQ